MQVVRANWPSGGMDLGFQLLSRLRRQEEDRSSRDPDQSGGRGGRRVRRGSEDMDRVRTREDDVTSVSPLHPSRKYKRAILRTRASGGVCQAVGCIRLSC